jgi:hypothetical protein
MKRFLIIFFFLISLTAQAQMNPFTPPGSLQMFGGATAPTGWLICDGSIVTIAQYPRLYAALGTAYNRTGETPGVNFRIPDMRGIFPVGVGQSGPYGVNYTGVRGGYSQDISQTFSQPHGHAGITAVYRGAPPAPHYVYREGDQGGGPGSWYGIAMSMNYSGGLNNPSTEGLFVGSGGGGLPARSGNVTIPSSLGVNYIIKY